METGCANIETRKKIDTSRVRGALARTRAAARRQGRAARWRSLRPRATRQPAGAVLPATLAADLPAAGRVQFRPLRLGVREFAVRVRDRRRAHLRRAAATTRDYLARPDARPQLRQHVLPDRLRRGGVRCLPARHCAADLRTFEPRGPATCTACSSCVPIVVPGVAVQMIWGNLIYGDVGSGERVAETGRPGRRGDAAGSPIRRSVLWSLAFIGLPVRQRHQHPDLLRGLRRHSGERSRGGAARRLQPGCANSC